VALAPTPDSTSYFTKGTLMAHRSPRRFDARLAALATAAALAFTFTGAAMAQPHGGPGHRGPMGGDDLFANAIAHAKANLNLNTSQQTMFDAAVAQSKAAREQGRALRQSVKDALTTELAKPEPDLAAVAAVADNARAQGQALRQQVRAQWLNLYATFSPEQKGVVRDLLQQRLARMEAFRQKMQQRFQGGGTSG
jgi:Spy/CpxP family protein refolding chaperone